MHRDIFHKIRVWTRRGLTTRLAAIAMFAIGLLFLSSLAIASLELTVFGPKKYERLQGKPIVYTDTFSGCNGNGQAILRVANGDSDETRITSAEIFVNDAKAADEDDFKKHVSTFDRTITIRDSNVISVKLKSGRQGRESFSREDDRGRKDEKDFKGKRESKDDEKDVSSRKNKEEREDDHESGDDDHDEHDKDTHAPSFIVVEVIAQGCDSKPPVISDPQPPDGSLQNTATPHISAQYQDEPGGAGVDSSTIHLIVDGQDVTASAVVTQSSLEYAPSANLPEGPHTVTLDLSDLAHNPASLTWHFTTDTIAPRIAITSQQNDQYLNTPAITVSGAVDDASAAVLVNGKPATVSNGQFSLAGLGLVEGRNTILVTATDPAGNSSSQSLLLDLDTQAPVVSITTPSEGDFVSSHVVTVSGIVTELHPADIRINGIVGTLSADGSYSQGSVPLSPGPNTITVTAKDLAGNETTASVNVVLDDIPPTITVASPLSDSWLNTPRIAISGTVNEPCSSVTVNGKPAVLSGTNFTLSDVDLVEGQNTISVQAIDMAGNPAAASITVTLDTVPPVVQIATPKQNAVVNTAVIGVTGVVSEPVTTVNVNALSASVADLSYDLASYTLAEGSNTISVTAIDRAGNSGTAAVTIVLDTIPPDRPVISQPATPTNIAQTSVQGTAEAGSTVQVYWSVSSGAPVLVGTAIADTQGMFNVPNVVLSEGQNLFTATATDTALNTSAPSLPVMVLLDTVPPVVTITTPMSGELLNQSQVMVSGTVSEPINSLTVNNVAAIVTGLTFTATVSLPEGANSITASAMDLAGNAGSAGINVTIDSIAPASPVLGQPATPINTPRTSISGTAEPNSAVHLFAQAPNSASEQIAVLVADSQGKFAIPDIALVEGTTTFTATAIDAAGNASGPSLPVSVTLDTIPPIISVTAPTNNAFTNTGTIDVIGSLDDASALLTIDGASVALDNRNFSHPLALTSGLNSIVLVATDLASNTSSTTVLLTLDQTPPNVTITTPISGSIQSSSQVTVSGSVDKPVLEVTVNGVPAQLTGMNFSLTNLTVSEGTGTITASAVDQAGNRGSQTVNLTIDTQPPVVTLTAPSQAAAGTTITLSLSAEDATTGISIAEMSANANSFWSALPQSEFPSPQSISYTVSPDMAPGSIITLQARATDKAGNIGTSTAEVAISQGPSGPGYIQGEVYDDSKGLLLSNATITVTGTGGTDQGSLVTAVTGTDGGYYLETAKGDYLIALSGPGFTNVERTVTVKAEQKSVAIDARLTPISTQQNLIDGNGGTAKAFSDADESRSTQVELDVPANGITELTDIRVTPISNQGLANLLPAGWSPIAVVDIRDLPRMNTDAHGYTFALAATLKVPALTSLNLAPNSLVTLASYDLTSHHWIVQNSGTISSDGATIVASLPSTGQYAFVLSDSGNPPSSPYASPLTPDGLSTSVVNASDITASGAVVPPAAPPSEGLQAKGELVITPSPLAGEGGGEGGLYSGLILNAKVTERFDLLSGDSLVPSDYTQDLVLYRYPSITNIGSGIISQGTETQGSGVQGSGASGSISTTFPVTPSHQFTIVDLLMGKVGISITLPEPDAGGSLVGADGGRLLDADGTVIAIPQGALSQTVPIQTKTVSPAVVSGIVGPDFTLLRAVNVTITGAVLNSTAELSIPMPAGFNSSFPVVIAKAIDVKGTTKLKLVALAKSSGSLLTSLATGPLPLAPGITASGMYFFLQAKAPLGYVTGTVTDSSGNLFGSALVATDTCSLADLTGPTGTYLVASTISNFGATATDIYKYDVGTGTGAITTAGQTATVNLRVMKVPPQVVSLDPVNGELKVLPSAAIVITFNKPLDKSTVNLTNIVLSDPTGTAVPGAFSVNPEGTVVTFYPGALLQSQAKYSLLISKSIADLQGYTLGQDVTSVFTIKNMTPPPMPPAGSIVATFPDAEGYITITATQGSAEATGTILIINDTTGEIVSVTPATNGSFTGKISAQLGNEIKILSMDDSGNQTLITYIVFKSDDGKYLVTAKGGTVTDDASGAKLDIPEGALLGPTVIKITPVTEAQLPQNNPIPQPGKFLAAINVDTGGMNFRKEVHLSIPVPSGFDPLTPVFVTQPQVLQNADGTTENVYVVLDSTKVVNGRITTASPPFDGIWTFGIFSFTAFPTIYPAIVDGYTYRDMNGNNAYDSAIDQPVKGAVIRSPGGWNYVSYSKDNGFYATFTDVTNDIGTINPEGCKDYTVTAIHPQTMNRVTLPGFVCTPPYNIERLNFKLADKDTQFPDKTPPVITMKMQIAAGQGPNAKFIAGTVPINTEIEVPISVIDQQMAQPPTLSITFKTPVTQVPYPSLPPLSLMGSSIHTYMTPDNPVPIYEYTYQANFVFPAVGSSSTRFKPTEEGTYVLTLDAIDAAGNRSTSSISVRAVIPGAQPEGIDGPPIVDEILPGDKSKGIMINTPVVVTFDEPVNSNTVNNNSFMLMDLGPVNPATALPFSSSPGVKVNAAISTSLDSGKVVATLQPFQSLAFGHQYQVIVTQGIMDLVPNSAATCTAQTPPQPAGCSLPLDKEYRQVFTTKLPQVYDLISSSSNSQGQITEARGIDLYTGASGSTYAYLVAGTDGWYVIDVTDPARPTVVKSHKVTGADFWSERGVAVDPETSTLAITEDIEYSDGNQYGYVRFYDLSATPEDPRPVGREKVAEAWSGIPGRVALKKDFAYIATVNAGLQVVDIDAAKEFMQSGQSADGSTIVGVFDTVGQGYRQATDIAAYKDNRAILTTTSGHLITLDLSIPQMPQQMAAYKPTPGPTNYDYDSAWRVAVAPDYSYIETGQGADFASPKMIDLAVTASMQGRVHTVDVTDPYNPTPMGVARDEAGNELLLAGASDLTVSKTSGLAYVTVGNTLYIIDIKDPRNPKLLNSMTQAMSGDFTQQVLLGYSSTIVEKDGWLYLANEQTGMKTINLITVDLANSFCPSNGECFGF